MIHVSVQGTRQRTDGTGGLGIGHVPCCRAFDLTLGDPSAKIPRPCKIRVVDSARPFLFNTGPDISLRWPTSHGQCITPSVIVVVTMERIYLDWEKRNNK